MQEVESKRKLTPADGAHIFYTAIFLSAAYIVKSKHMTQCSVNLELFNDLLFYGLLLWATFLIITLVPRYKNEGLRLFFNLIDVLYGLFHIALVCYAGTKYFSKDNDCEKFAPELNFLANLYIWVTGVSGIIVIIGFGLWFFKRYIRPSDISGFHKADL